MKKRKRVLIISEIFYPSNRIGGIRPTKLAKYLHKMGYEITVFTSDNNIDDQSFAPLPFQVIYSHQKDGKQTTDNRKRVKPKKQNVNAFIQELKRLKREVFDLKKNLKFLSSFKMHIADGSIDLSGYDCVFSTFGPIGSLLCGLEAKKTRKSIKWINDFRDPMVSQITSRILRPIYKRFQNRSIEKADYTTTVSYGYSKRIGHNAPNKKIFVIRNGYDVEDKPQISQAESGASSFSFAYTGTLYEGKRDISVLFEQLNRLINDKDIDKEKVIFHYAGLDYEFLRKQAGKYGLENIIIDHGMVSRTESIKILSESRFLVLSTWNDKGEEGVFPGKILEYMLMEKPIISLVGGALPNSEITKVIVDNRLGISYESAAPQLEKDLYEWLKEQATRFNDSRPALFDPDSESVSREFDWNNIVKAFSELIDE
jgi:glycosyltransferase involved in cell wall biosynthesis